MLHAPLVLERDAMKAFGCQTRSSSAVKPVGSGICEWKTTRAGTAHPISTTVVWRSGPAQGGLARGPNELDLNKNIRAVRV